MLSPLPSTFAQLTARPPTPPRETSKAVDDAIAFLDDSNELDRLLNNQAIHANPSESASTTSLRRCEKSTANVGVEPKRVGFSLETIDIDSEISGQDSSPAVQLVKRLSAEKNAKTVRSILKSTHPVLPPTPDSLKSKLETFSPDIPGSFARMLQSIVQQLAGSSRVARLDAYLAINGVLKTYAGVPDVEAMAQRMDLFMQFLARDMSWKDPEGNLDMNVITQSLKLTSTILNTPTLAEALDSDFKACLIDRSLTVFEQPSMPKAVVKAHLIVAAQPRFHANLLSTGRADKLLTALKTIEERCTGNSVIAARLIIYLRMIERCPSLMLTRMSDWIEHVFHGMLSSIKDIRTRAIEVCTEAGVVFGQQPAAGKALHAMLLTEIEDGQSYFDFLLLRLLELIPNEEIGPYVPQIWSAVVLFFRTKRVPLSKWPKFKSWLIVIQKCLNSSDTRLRHYAILAWNKLVFAVMPDASTDRNLTSMLKVPLAQRLTKRASDKSAQQLYQDALGGYCNLLHYSLRPGLAREDLDIAWEVQLSPVLSDLVKANGKGRQTACQLLCGVFTGTTGIWNVNAALEQLYITPNELPRLDPRWVRSRLDKIIPVIEPILTTAMYSPTDANRASDSTWSALMHSIADAGSQEVKTSQDLKGALAILINVLHRLWLACKEAQLGAGESRWLQRYVTLVQIMVDSLGSGPFAEDILTAAKDENIEVAPTPSQKQTKAATQPQSPMMILLYQFLHPPSGLAVDDEYSSAVSALLKLLTRSKTTPTGRLSLLDNCLQLLSPSIEAASEPDTRYLLWSSVASAASTILTSDHLVIGAEESQSTGQALRHASHILAAGLALATDEEAYRDIESLYESMQKAATDTAGDSGVVLALAEPFSKAVTDTKRSDALNAKMRFGCKILEQVGWPKSRQSIDTARKSLWGVSLHPQKTGVFDPFDHVYTMINEVATSAYMALDKEAACTISNEQRFLLATLNFLDRSPMSLLSLALREVQPGLTVWVRDQDRKTGRDESLSQLIRDMWTIVIRLLKKIPSKGNDFLRVTMDIMIAGMSSPHKAIVNDCIVFWNNTLGKEEVLEYPHALETVLRARAIDAEIVLPTFPNSNGENDVASLPAFFETQPEQSPLEDPSHGPSNSSQALRSPNVTLTSLKKTYPYDARSPLRNLHNQSTPSRRAARKSASVTPKPRLRHDDSQIQFAPIEASPLPSVDHSQLLTEHQKEVKSRQHENAHIFQDLSSSPTAHSTALPRALSKRLDFASYVQPQGHDDVQETPSGLVDGAGLMSDDLPSSPTPSSGRDACPDPVEDADEADGDDLLDAPPSSPPQPSRVPSSTAQAPTAEKEAVRPNDTAVLVADIEIGEDDAALHAINGHTGVLDHAVEGSHGLGSDLPSDSILPTIQLQQEEEEASLRLSFGKSNTGDATDVIMFEGNDHDPEQNAAQTQSNSGADDNDVSRVKNSFVEQSQDASQDDMAQSSESQQSQRGSKKRKRSTASFWSSKKRKQQSPLKRLATYLLGQSQEEEDDNDDDDMIGDEIVVASSQRFSSPDPQTTAMVSTSQPDDALVHVVKEEETVEIMPPPLKRGRGRPRKSGRSPTGQTEEADTLKKTASTLGEGSVLDPPQLSETAEKTVNLDAEPQPLVQHKRVTRKTATAVLVSSTDSLHAEAPIAANALGVHEQQDNEPVNSQEQGEVAPTKSIVTARSLLSRLQETLADIGGIILGSQEEREFDDVLFAIRREVHEAGSRGRQSTG